MISSVIEYQNSKIDINQSPTKYVGDKFLPGFYSCILGQQGMTIVKEHLQEQHIPYTTESNMKILNVLKSFFADGVRENINKLGFIHKIGILTFGRAGTGKTSLMNYAATSLMEHREAIVFICNSRDTLIGGISLSKMIRKTQNNPIVFIADEFDRYAEGGEAEMKMFLDGNDSIDNMIFLAATNYINKIPDTLKERPSRFKVVEEITGITDIEHISAIIKDISDKADVPLFTEDEIKKIVKDQKDLTLDEIKHICLDKATNNYLPNTISRKKIGFNVKARDKEKSAFEFFTLSPTFWGSKKY